MIVSNDSVKCHSTPVCLTTYWQLWLYTHYYLQTNTLSQMVAIHSWPDFDDLPRGHEANLSENEASVARGQKRGRGQILRGRGQKIWPWCCVGLEDLTSLLFWRIVNCELHERTKGTYLDLHSQTASDLGWQVDQTPDGKTTLKLYDLGLAAVTSSTLYAVCGTPTYMAPEMIRRTGCVRWLLALLHSFIQSFIYSFLTELSGICECLFVCQQCKSSVQYNTWNCLPASVLDSDCLAVFKSTLKTHRIGLTLPVVDCWPVRQRLWSYFTTACTDLEWPFCVKFCFAPVCLERWSLELKRYGGQSTNSAHRSLRRHLWK